MSVQLPFARLARLTLAAALCGAPALSQEVSCLVHEQALVGPLQPTLGTLFGQSVSTDGVRTAVGMTFADHPTLPGVKGSVRVYERNASTWVLEETVLPSNPSPSPGYFGEIVALDGDVLAVAHTDAWANLVYVFRRGPGSWVEEAQLTPPDGPLLGSNLTRYFGASLDVAGDTIAIGAINDDDVAAWGGAVYVFRHAAGSWSFEAKLHADDPWDAAKFGTDVDLDGERLLVGAPGRQSANWVTGAGYVFERSGGVWNLDAHLQIPCCSTYEGGPLGRSVALHGDHAALGNVENEDGDTLVFTFSRAGGTWSPQTPIASQNPNHYGWVGLEVEFASESRLLISNATAINGGINQQTGEVQVFDYVDGQWADAGVVLPTLDDTNSYFGQSLSAAGSLLVVGAKMTEINFNKLGAVNFVHIGTAPTRYCTAKTNSAGCVPSVTWSGSPSYADPQGFTVGAAGVLAQQVGILIWAQSAAALPFGGGTLCVGSPLTRTPGQTSGGGALGTCTGSYAFTFDGIYLLTQGLAPGVDLHAQYWSRDTGFAPPNAIGLTDAVLFTACP